MYCSVGESNSKRFKVIDDTIMSHKRKIAKNRDIGDAKLFLNLGPQATAVL